MERGARPGIPKGKLQERHGFGTIAVLSCTLRFCVRDQQRLVKKKHQLTSPPNTKICHTFAERNGWILVVKLLLLVFVDESQSNPNQISQQSTINMKFTFESKFNSSATSSFFPNRNPRYPCRLPPTVKDRCGSQPLLGFPNCIAEASVDQPSTDVNVLWKLTIVTVSQE